jgi:hypothetical protein
VQRYPEVLVRYRGAPARAEELLRGVAPQALAWRDEPGRWSMLENVGHLLDLEALWERRVEDYVAGAPRLAAADMTNRATHDADYNARDAGGVLAAFRAARGRVVARLEALDEGVWGRVSVHPRLNQPMRLVDAIEFTCQHDDYHLARVQTLRAAWRAA